MHGLWYTKVYFQIGMLVGDKQEHIKIGGFRGGNGLYRQHVCRDCLVSTEDADNPDIECELREVGDAYKFLKQKRNLSSWKITIYTNMLWCDSD